MSPRTLFFPFSTFLLGALLTATVALAQPPGSATIDYDGELEDGVSVTGSVESSTDFWDYYLMTVTQGTEVTVSVTETSGLDHDIFVYQGAGTYPTGSTVSVLGPQLGFATQCCVSTRTITFTPDFTGPATVIIEDDDCCSPAGYELVATGIAGRGPIDLVAPNGFFESGQSITLPVVLADSALTKNGGVVNRIAGVDFDLTFDPSLVSVDSVTLGSAVPDWLLESNLAAPGVATIAISSLTTLDAIFASHEIVQVHFRAIGSRGDSRLDLVDSHVFDDTPLAIDHGVIEGLLIVGCDPGDVLKDGDLNTADTILTLLYAVDLLTPSTEEFCAADINDDEVIDAADAVANLRRVVGLNRAPADLSRSPQASFSAVDGVLELSYDASAGLQALLRFDPASLAVRSVTDTAGNLLRYNDEVPGELRLASASSRAADGAIRLRFDRLDGGHDVVDIEELRAFDEDGVGFDRRGETRLSLSGDRVEGPATAKEMGFVSAAPNPFNPRVELRFRVSAASEVELSVFDTAGRLVRTLAYTATAAGEHQIAWNGTDHRGQTLASGAYIVRLTTGEVSDEVRVLLLK